MVDVKSERRQDPRAPIAVRAQVRGFDPDGTPWEEHATTLDVSRRGAQLPMQHLVEKGQIVLLELPLPAQFRRYDPGHPLYRAYGLVRHVRATPDGQQVGLRFLGKEAPRNYEKCPACRYALPGEPLPAGPLQQQLGEPSAEEPQATAPTARSEERRHARRLEVFADFRIQRLDPAVGSERTVAENIGPGGARVLTSLSIQPGEVLRIEEVDGSFAARAEVVNVYFGENQTLRLNLRFLDAELPKRLLPDLPD
jgi:hypothetical protein